MGEVDGISPFYTAMYVYKIGVIGIDRLPPVYPFALLHKMGGGDPMTLRKGDLVISLLHNFHTHLLLP